MKYTVESWSISSLIKLYDENKLNLNPPYQRNDIWSLPAKKRLIDTIKKKFPLPNFFLYLNTDGNYEMVDGQQRTRTFLGYKAGLYPDTNKDYIKDSDENYFLNEYKLIIVILSEVSDQKLVVNFYHDVNKFGAKLNRPEILRSEHFENPVQNLIEEISEDEKFKELELFSGASQDRLMDQDFIGELLSIINYGITDKKKHVDTLFIDLKDEPESLNSLTEKFWSTIEIIRVFNNFYPLKQTRYKQKNDFYTLFSFCHKYIKLSEKLFELFYNILVKVDSKIVPSNEDCFAFQNYAFNCVSQSNSKKARDLRLSLLETIMFNQKNDYILEEEEYVNDFEEIMIYFNIKNEELVTLNGYYLLPIEKL